MIVVESSGLSHAQNNLPLAQTRAATLARIRAELLNGGLGAYRADQCMYVTGAKECLVSTTKEGFRFQFRGGAPGWQQLIPAEPTLETEVIISRDDDRIIAVPYNGPLR